MAVALGSRARSSPHSLYIGEGGNSEAGELAPTTLTTRAFPLVRYRTGDLVRFIPGNCPCGRSLSRIARLPTRADDMRVIRGVKIHHQQILNLLERMLGRLPHAHRFLMKKGLSTL